MAKSELTPALLRELILYDPDTGEMEWAERDAELMHRLGVDEGDPAEKAAARFNARFAGELLSPSWKNDFAYVLLPTPSGKRTWAPYYAVAWKILTNQDVPQDRRILSVDGTARRDSLRRESYHVSVPAGTGVTGYATKHGVIRWQFTVSFLDETGKRRHRRVGGFDTLEEAVQGRKQWLKDNGMWESLTVDEALAQGG